MTASTGVACRASSSLSSSIRTRSRDNWLEPARAAMQAATPAASGSAAGRRRRESERSAGCADNPRRCACRVADEAHAPRLQVGEPADVSCTTPSAPTESAFMVKSRRSASACQSRPKRTLAWRPKVSTSWRKRRHLERPAVDHDGDGAVLDAGRHRLEARRRRRGASPLRGTAVVATSNSLIGSPSSALRTAPPTTRASSPSRPSTPSKPRQRALPQPRGVLERGLRFAHRSTRPGTNWPSSTWAGS